MRESVIDPIPFSALPRTPAAHFRLYFFGAVLRVIALAAETLGGVESLLQRCPFLRGYLNELADQGLEGMSLEHGPRWWREAVLGWERAAPGRLPLSDLGNALSLDYETLLLLIAAGLTEEDERFADVYRILHGQTGHSRPTAALLGALSDRHDHGDARPLIRQLAGLGLLEIGNARDPYPAWTVSLPAPIWEAIRGEFPGHVMPWLRYRRAIDQVPLGDLIVPPAVRTALERLPALIAAGDVGGVVVRGPRRNGRRTLLGAVAACAGYGVLEVRGLVDPEDARWRLLGPLATLLKAMPVVVLDPAPGETARVPGLPGHRGPSGIVLGPQGGIEAELGRIITLVLQVPDPDARKRHWAGSLGGDDTEAERLAAHFRMTSGTIRRAAALAKAHAKLAARSAPTIDDVREATRTLNREALDTLAAREPARGDWSQGVFGHETRQELATLEERCRQRENLAARVGPALAGSLNPGVRALLKGPSGTGKTLAARILAATLGMDLYRVDLSAVVNKYIGETEKNLHRIFSRAEELDVILLFDEGDSLFGKRTGVTTANDRYANLETNFLLQRIESYEGIVIVTTNAADHIDTAFERRMDVVVEFRPPDAAERLAIWKLHLPRDHCVADGLLQEVAYRCALTGGQIRNAVLHAALLAGIDGGAIGAGALEESIAREYRKRGAVCPLRPALLSAVSGA